MIFEENLQKRNYVNFIRITTTTTKNKSQFYLSEKVP